ncbi:MAG: hypothetical protein NW200_12830 [Hyphomonadaceae bacterium]|nr:hypothetical protein [Hyphomonadaceae bacterium]
MSAPVRKYAFDTVFDADGAVLREGARTRSYTVEEVEAERSAAFAAGRDDETARAQAAMAQAVQQIAASAGHLVSAITADRRVMLADAARLALAAARVASGAALDRFGEARVAAALDAAFDGFVGAPRVVVRIAPALSEARAMLEEIARSHGFDGALVVRADPAVRAGDVSIDWGEGSIAHDSADALRRIEAMVSDALANNAGDDATGAHETGEGRAP